MKVPDGTIVELRKLFGIPFPLLLKKDIILFAPASPSADARFLVSSDQAIITNTMTSLCLRRKFGCKCCKLPPQDCRPEACGSEATSHGFLECWHAGAAHD